MGISMRYREAYDWGVSRLAGVKIEESTLDARLLLEYVCGTDRNTLLAHGDREVEDKEQKEYQALIEERAKHIPLQYLTGTQEFMGLTYMVNQNVLIPRQDTEVLVEEVMRNLHDGMRILDMCTGSGCILLSLLQYSNDCTGIGVDLSKEALAVAEENYRRLKENKPEMSAEFLQSDLFDRLVQDEVGRFDIVVSNPPYIRTDVIDTLMPEVREHEPIMALDGREDGLYFYRKITAGAKAFMNRGGMLFYEIGCGQSQEVAAIMRGEGFSEIEVVKDFAGLDRVVCGVM